MQKYTVQVKHFYLLLLLSAVAFCFVPLSKAHAADIALGVYPPLIQITANAPSDIKSPMTIYNQSDSPVDIKVVVRPFTSAESDDGQPAYFPQGHPISPDPDIYQKMSLFDGTKNTDTITLAPKQRKNVELRIHLPTGEPPADYYFSITFLSNPVATDHVSGSKVAGGVSTNVLLSIGPKDRTTGFIKEFSSPLFIQSGPVPFTVHVANTSHHFISPQGTIYIKNMFGQTIGKVNLGQEIVLANTSRYLPDSNVVPLLSTAHPAAIWGEKFLLGPYAATLTIALSDQGPLYRQTIYFFALPIQVLLGIILGIIVVGIIIYRVKLRLRLDSQ